MKTKTIYTVIFGDYEELKEPLIKTPGWRYICFTDQPRTSKHWEVIVVNTGEDKRMESREYKINFHKYIEDFESIYIDGSFIINCDLTKWWKAKFKTPVTFVKHPRRSCVFEEIDRCIYYGRCETDKLLKQKEAYKDRVRTNGGVIQSGLMMRQKTPTVIDLMLNWWEELQKYSTRDQIAMGYVAEGKRLNVIDWNYARAKEFIFKQHYNRRPAMNRTIIINAIIEKNKFKRYLEIGVGTGVNFAQIKCFYKVSVDPDPKTKATRPVTSDAFFNGNKKVTPTKCGDFITYRETFDVVFVDGLHHVEQATADAFNAWQVLNEGGYLVIHDTNPDREEITQVPRNTKEWCGDVYKLAAQIQNEKCTFSGDHGVTIIRKTAVPLTLSGEEISFEQLSLNRKALLQLADQAGVMKYINQ